jgi:hypothetical protein
LVLIGPQNPSLPQPAGRVGNHNRNLCRRPDDFR